MEPNCCKDDTCKPGTLNTPSPCFNDCLLSISKDDFKRIDTNNSGALTGQELKSATESGIFEGQTQKMLECVSAHVNNTKVDATVNGQKMSMGATLPSWYGTDFAKDQISNDDFKLIDSNGDNVLDSNELKAATTNTGLSRMDRHAASVLNEHLDAALNDPLLDVKGGIKNWHKDETNAAAVSDKPKVGDTGGVAGIDPHFDETVAVSKLDANGNPTELETQGGKQSVKYDEKNRIVGITTNFGDSDTATATISYDDALKTQTIKSHSAWGDGSSVTVNHLDNNGKKVREDFASKSNSYESATTTRFDDQGRIVEQSRKDDGQRVQSSVEYGPNGQRTASKSTYFDESGKKTRDSTYNYADKSSSVNYFDDQGRITRHVDVTRSADSKKPIVNETTYDQDGNKTGSTEIMFSNKPYLVGQIIQKDADGKATASATADWRMVSPSMGRVDSIEYKDANGETRTLNAKSTGADAKLFHQLQNRFHRNSTTPHEERVDEESPGTFVLPMFTSAPC